MFPNTRLYPKPGKIVQLQIGSMSITWNPDDERFYVERGNETIGNYKDWRNATARLRKELKTIQ